MDNKEYIARIMKMSAAELLEEVTENPDYLVQVHYKEFGVAMMARFEQLKEEEDDE